MKSIFVVQKRAIRVLLRQGPRGLCRDGFILKDKIDIFKQRLKDFLISNAFYSINEYMLSKQV
jgi:hypothetical protein